MVQFGIDQVIKQNPVWKNKSIALVTNNAATSQALQPSRQVLLQNGFNIVKLFSPEHGLDVKGVDGEAMHDGIDTLTNLPVISLYNKKLEPSAIDLMDVDIVLFDIPDVGCRYYTYLWTLTYVVEACTKYNTLLIVLDRPNPISGLMNVVEGPLLDEESCSSFIGRWEIPLRHSCTFGELATYFNQAKNIQASLQVIKCENWNRSMFQPDWAIDFVPTSPAIKNINAAMLYPGLGLLEATNISEGRGTDLSFQIAGAPWMSGINVAAAFNHFGLTNVQLQPISFTPSNSKYQHQLCKGVQFNITDANTYLPVFTALLFIKLVKDLYPQHFQWNTYPTNVNPLGNNHLDKLLGLLNSQKIFDLPMRSFLQKIEIITASQDWKSTIKDYLLYE